VESMSKTQNPGASLKCFAFVDNLPGTQCANVRTPDKGLGGVLMRAQERLAAKLVGDSGLHSHVRGNKVAIDYVLNALLEHSPTVHYSFVVNFASYGIFKQWAGEGNGHRSATIHTLAEVLRPGLDALGPDIWLDLFGDGMPALLRHDLHSSRVFPTVRLVHGLFNDSALRADISQMMLVPTYGCDSLVCTSTTCQKTMENLLEEVSSSYDMQFGAKIRFNGRLDRIPLCVDTEVFRPGVKASLRKELSISKDAIVLLYVGYIALIKTDLMPLLPMIRRIVDGNPEVNLQFIIAGTGPETYEKCLQALIEELRLQKHVKQYRCVSETMKQKLYASADIFVAPCESFEESFGLAPVEAMASGLPQVVANWDGYRDTVSHGVTGFLVPTLWGRCDDDLRGTEILFGKLYNRIILGQSVSLDISDMQERIECLIRNPDLRASMSANSRARAVTEFSYKNVARRYEELFSELVAISRSIEPTQNRKRSPNHTFFDSYRHFASRELTDESVISAAAGASLQVSRMLRGVKSSYVEGVPLFDESLLRQIISTASLLGGTRGSVTVESAISQIAGESCPPDVVRRHILFLIKHGGLNC
jgi:D-inositol-3-phosphate glycosyltransferase